MLLFAEEESRQKNRSVVGSQFVSQLVACFEQGEGEGEIRARLVGRRSTSAGASRDGLASRVRTVGGVMG